MGLGYKRKNDRLVKDRRGNPVVSIQFTVEEKAAPEQLEAIGTEKLPKSFRLNGETIPTDVVERAFEPRHRLLAEAVLEDHGQLRKTRRDPIEPGVSIANEKSSAGTLGAIVYDRRNGAPCVLSNWHVLHGATGEVGDAIVQPGPFDDNSGIARNRMGKLIRSHLGLAGDCALASIDGRAFSAAIFELNVVPRRVADPELGDRVVKSGRTTGITYGVVSRVEVTARIPYQGHGEERIGAFEVVTNPEKRAANGEISEGGDSGSLWLIDDAASADVALGLHFAGETDPDPEHEYALACPLRTVLRKLEISFEAPAAPPPGPVPVIARVVPEPRGRREAADARSLSLDEVQQIKARLWSADPDVELEDALLSTRLVAEGDSWFDYPPGLDILDLLKKNHGYSIFKVADAGDTLENMVYGTEITNNFQRKAPQIEQTLKAIREHHPRVFLFSGGGNDFAGDEFDAYVNHKDSKLPPMRDNYVAYMIDEVFAKAYRDLFAKVWDADAAVQIIVHGYARPVPDGRAVFNFPFGFRFVGPWLRPTLTRKGISVEGGTPLIGELIDRFNAMLDRLATAFPGKVHHLDLRPLVGPDDWTNELHLYNDAYARVAAHFDQKIRQITG